MIALYIPLFPLLAFLLLIVGRKVWKKSIAASIGIGATGIAFFCSLPVLWESIQKIKPVVWKFDWFQMGLYEIQLSFELGALQVLMLVIVCGVSFLVQIYSWGYMKGDERLPAFYAYLSLFTFSMLGLVISANLLQIYIFWELVGVCSFLLIGFWYFKPEAKAAAKKAFIVTRIGDLGLFIAIGLLFAQIGSFELSDLKTAIAMGELEAGLITLTAILIFIGAIGKSGQFPLHTWLPDAMEGPTPVSALIHAATMVAAGVYLVANLFFLFQASETAMTVVAYVGGFTAIFAATIGIAQNDIKRVLAYSTVSQLGFMMLALGSAGYVAGIFHLMTHSFFKALLFLGAGAVILSLHHVQDLRKMGGLWKTHRWLGIWFLVGCLSIAGIPPFSGFFSKDEILLSTYADGRIGLFVVGMTAAFFTAFYMFRLFFLAFTGEARSEQQPSRVSGWMMVPIVILGLLSVGAGFAQTPTSWLGNWLTESSGITSISHTQAPSWIPIVAVVVSVLGISLAYVMYVMKPSAPATLAGKLPWLYQLVHRKYYIDECYEVMFVYSLKGLGWFLYGWDRFIVGGLVHLSASLVSWFGQLGSRLQNGQVQTYVLISLIGFVLLLVGLTAGRLFE